MLAQINLKAEKKQSQLISLEKQTIYLKNNSYKLLILYKEALQEVMTLFAARYKNIGLRIADYRKKKGYTQAELAERIGMSAAYLGQIERGNRGNSFSLETLYQIADALEIDVNLLIKSEMLV